MITNKKELSLIHQLNKSIALFALPLIGMGIPFITGLITYQAYTVIELILIHLFFAMIAYMIWYLNVLFFKRIRITELGQNAKQNLQSGLLFMGLNILISGLVSYSLIHFFLAMSKEKNTTQGIIIMTCLLTIVSAVALGMIYEYFLLQLKWRIVALSKKDLTKATLQANISSLEPHFLFNALGTLSGLISNEHEEIRKYNQMLSDTYHYILHKRNLATVNLEEEVNFMLQYLKMIDYVYPDKIHLINLMDSSDLSQYLIPPISLQLLIENAIKHNGFTTEKPLQITIEKTLSNIIIRNFLQEKKTSIQISGTGLNNLNDRCVYFTGKPISIIQTQTEFLVQIPIKRIKS